MVILKPLRASSILLYPSDGTTIRPSCCIHNMQIHTCATSPQASTHAVLSHKAVESRITLMPLRLCIIQKARASALYNEYVGMKNTPPLEEEKEKGSVSLTRNSRILSLILRIKSFVIFKYKNKENNNEEKNTWKSK